MHMNVEMKRTTLPSGVECFYQHWFPDSPRALVVMVHGLGDHSSRYNELISTLGIDGFACAVFDQRGHGQTKGVRGHVSSFDHLLADLGEFIDFSKRELRYDVPLFLIGGSLGGLTCINYVVHSQSKVAGMILASAAITPNINIPPWKQKIVRTMAKIYPSLTVFNGLNFEDITRDEDEIAALMKDPYFHRRISMGTAVEVEARLKIIMAMPHRIYIPTLILAGSKDKICNPQGARQFADRLASSDKIFKMYNGMVHDLLHDVGRKQVIEDMRNWLLARTPFEPVGGK